MQIVPIVMGLARRKWQISALLVLLTLNCIVTSGTTRIALAAQSSRAAVRDDNQRLTLSYQDVPLEQAAAGLARATGIQVLLDRRIDPTQRISIVVDDLLIDEAFAQLAASSGTGYSRIGQMSYLGPSQRAAQLRTLAALVEARISQLPAEAQKRWHAEAELTWPHLTQPEELIGMLTSQAGAEISGGEPIPHDLWGAQHYGRLPLGERLVWLLIQFDLTLAISKDGSLVRFVPVPDDVRIQKSYAAGSNPAGKLAQWTELAPEAEIRQQGNRLIVRARQEDHDRLALVDTSPRRVPQARPPVSADPQQKLSLRVRDAQLETLLAQLAGRLQFEIAYTANFPEEMKQTRVSIEVTDATLDELLDTIAADAEISYQRSGQRVIISPAQ